MPVFSIFFFLFLQENRLSSPTSRVSAKLPPGDRFLEEFDYERRLKKRKVKLVVSTEEAFAHLGRVSQDRVKGISGKSYLLRVHSNEYSDFLSKSLEFWSKKV